MTAPDRAGIERAVDLGDIDGLTRLIDRLCGDRDWDGLLELRDRCRAAADRGRQLWPAAAHAEYRLALEAPGPWAGRMLEHGSGRYSLGPLAEVAASTHTWAELLPHASPGPLITFAAHERVVRGEDLRNRQVVEMVMDMPLVLQPWEPEYPLAIYEPDRATFPSPPLPPLVRALLPPTGRPASDGRAYAAFRDAVGAWTAESNGRAEVAVAEGNALAAVALLGPPSARVGRISLADALAQLAWAGASGGAHGRRKGMAQGRFSAWWVVAAVTGLLDEWPVPPDRLGRAGESLGWYAWDAGEPVTGWSLHLAVEDPARGRAWAVAATDAD